jgi:cation/acetate symporter
MQNVQDAVSMKIRANPKFQDLVTRRGRYAWTLAAIVLVIFYGFVLMVAFSPATLGTPIADGSLVTVGFVAGLTMFVFFWILTAVYVRRANSEFDALTRELINEAWQEARQ